MRRVLVTGASQPLGRAAIRGLTQLGAEHVLAVGIEDAPPPDLAGQVAWRRVDLSRARALKGLLHGDVVQQDIDTVVHLAFHRRPGARRAHKLHVDATRLLLRLCEGHPTVRRFVLRSSVEVYASRPDRPDHLREDHPLELGPGAPAWIRQRVEADLTACTRMGMTDLQVVVLRLAEIVAPDCGSQLYDYLSSRVCLRPMGFDPVLNLLSLEDAARAVALAAHADAIGVFNIPGADTLPLAWATRRWGRPSVGVPGPLLGPLYRLRQRVKRAAFRYDLNAWRFHFNGVLDGARAEQRLGYRPEHPLTWPEPGA